MRSKKGPPRVSVDTEATKAHAEPNVASRATEPSLAQEQQEQADRVLSARPSRIITPTDLSGEVTLFQNIDQAVIMIPEDRLKLLLIEHRDHLDSRRSWTTPAGLFAMIVLTLNTTTAHNSLGLDAATWHAIYLIGALLSGAWLVWTLILLGRKKVTIDDLIKRCRKPTA